MFKPRVDEEDILWFVALQENVVFLTQKARAHDTFVINFVVSSTTICGVYCGIFYFKLTLGFGT
jgi:hypothetical protein